MKFTEKKSGDEYEWEGWPEKVYPYFMGFLIMYLAILFTSTP